MTRRAQALERPSSDQLAVTRKQLVHHLILIRPGSGAGQSGGTHRRSTISIVRQVQQLYDGLPDLVRVEQDRRAIHELLDATNSGADQRHAGQQGLLGRKGPGFPRRGEQGQIRRPEQRGDVVIVTQQDHVRAIGLYSIRQRVTQGALTRDQEAQLGTIPNGARDFQDQTEILLGRQPTDGHDHHVLLGQPQIAAQRLPRNRCLPEYRRRHWSQPGIAGTQPTRLNHQVGAGTERQICASGDQSLQQPATDGRPALAENRVVPGHDQGHWPERAGTQSNRPGLVPVGVHDVRTSQPPEVRQRLHVRTKIIKALNPRSLSRCIDPYCVAPLYQTDDHARDVTADATCAGGQDLSDPHDRSAATSRRRTRFHSAAPRPRSTRKTRPTKIIMHRTAAPIAPIVAASRPASRSSITGQPTTPPATPAAGRQMSVERPNQDRMFPGSAARRARTAPTTAPTHNPSDTEAASATTCQFTGITTRAPNAATMTTAQAVMVTPPAARARCWASRVREHNPSTPNPTTAGASITISHASAAVSPDPGPRTNTLATGTAVATSKAAPRLASVIT